MATQYVSNKLPKSAVAKPQGQHDGGSMGGGYGQQKQQPGQQKQGPAQQNQGSGVFKMPLPPALMLQKEKEDIYGGSAGRGGKKIT